MRDGIVIGAVAAVGVAIANAVYGRTLELMFAALALVIAAQLVRRALKPS